MAGASGALHEAGDAFWRADLDDEVDGGKVDTEVEGGGADHALELSLTQALFDAVADFAVEGTVVHGELVAPLWAGGGEFLIPDFGLGTGVGEEEGGLMFVDLLRHLPHEAGAEVASPGEAFDVFGEKGGDAERFALLAMDDAGRFRGSSLKYGCGFFEVAEGGREAPGAELGLVLAETGEAEFGLHAALAAHEFVPLVDDHALEVFEVATRIFVGEKEGEGLGGSDEAEGGLFADFLFAVAGGVAGASLDFEVRGEFCDRFAQRFEGVGGEGAQRGEPENAKLRGGLRRRVFEFLCERAKEGGEGFAESGGGVDESAFASGVG